MASDAVFLKNVNVWKTFLISIVLVYDLLEHLTGISLYLFWLFTGLGSIRTALPLFLETRRISR